VLRTRQQKKLRLRPPKEADTIRLIQSIDGKGGDPFQNLTDALIADIGKGVY
jgi:hypothetical protein